MNDRPEIRVDDGTNYVTNEEFEQEETKNAKAGMSAAVILMTMIAITALVVGSLALAEFRRSTDAETTHRGYLKFHDSGAENGMVDLVDMEFSVIPNDALGAETVTSKWTGTTTHYNGTSGIFSDFEVDTIYLITITLSANITNGTAAISDQLIVQAKSETDVVIQTQTSPVILRTEDDSLVFNFNILVNADIANGFRFYWKHTDGWSFNTLSVWDVIYTVTQYAFNS